MDKRILEWLKQADYDGEGDCGVDKTAVLNIISHFAKALEAQHIRPQKIVLFGSHSTGT